MFIVHSIHYTHSSRLFVLCYVLIPVILCIFLHRHCYLGIHGHCDFLISVSLPVTQPWQWRVRKPHQLLGTYDTTTTKSIKRVCMPWNVQWVCKQISLPVKYCSMYITGHVILATILWNPTRGISYHDAVIKWKYFRVAGPLCGEFTGHRWISLTKASDAEFWCFLWSEPE